MYRKLLVMLVLSISLMGCSSTPKPLDAPCTYGSRSGCGDSIPLQQNI